MTRLRVAKRARSTDARRLPEVGTHAIVYEVAPLSASDPHDPNAGMQKVRVTLDRAGMRVGVGGGITWGTVALVAWGDLAEFAARRMRDETEHLRDRYRPVDGYARPRIVGADALLDLPSRTAEEMARWFYEAGDTQGAMRWRDASPATRADLVRRMRAVLDAGIVGPLVAADDEEAPR